jgi:hypothetical protein
MLAARFQLVQHAFQCVHEMAALLTQYAAYSMVIHRVTLCAVQGSCTPLHEGGAVKAVGWVCGCHHHDSKRG